MNTHCLFMISSIICLYYFTSFQLVSSLNYSSITRREIHVQRYVTTSYYKTTLAYISHIERDDQDTEATTNLKSWRGQNLTNLYLRHPHLKAAQGILNIIGWGTLLPVGAIIARNFRKFPMQWNEWYSFHVICQTGGYFLGTIGLFVGMLASNNNADNSKPHRILGIVIFTFTTIQMLAIFWQPKKEDERDYNYCWRKSWEIYHHLLGYVLIALIIADIFQGIKYQNQATKWRWIYIGIVGFLGVVAVSLEIYRWFKSKIIKETVELNSNMYTSP